MEDYIRTYYSLHGTRHHHHVPNQDHKAALVTTEYIQQRPQSTQEKSSFYLLPLGLFTLQIRIRAVPAISTVFLAWSGDQILTRREIYYLVALERATQAVVPPIYLRTLGGVTLSSVSQWVTYSLCLRR